VAGINIDLDAILLMGRSACCHCSVPIFGRPPLIAIRRQRNVAAILGERS
jgi:hypothetical protein